MDGQVTGYRVDGESVDSMELDGEAVVLNLRDHGYFGLNTTGTEVWDLVKAHPGIAASTIADIIGQRYGQESALVVGGVMSLLDELRGHGLVTECDPAAPPVAQVERCNRPYLAPSLQSYGNLDTLILSGE